MVEVNPEKQNSDKFHVSFTHKEPIRNGRSSVIRKNLEEVTRKKSLSQDPRMQKEKKIDLILEFFLKK